MDEVVLINMGKYQDALESITNKLNEDPDNQGYVNTRYAILEKIGKYDEIIDSIDINKVNTIPNLQFLQKIDRLLILATCHDKLGQHDVAIDILGSIRQELDQNHSTQPDASYMLSKYYTTYGMVRINQGKLEEAFDLYQKAVVIDSDDIKSSQRASLYNNLGIIYWHWGRIDNAIDSYTKSLEFYKQDGDKKGISRLSNNIGIIYYDKGQLKKALAFYHDSLKIDRDIGNQRSIGLTMSNLGELYRHLRDFEQSFHYLDQSIAILDQVDDPILQSVTLNQLILTSLEINDLEGSQHHLEKLQQINGQVDNTYVQLFTKFSKALILKHSKRAKQVIQSQELFQEIIDNEVIISEITVQSLFNLCEILINEVKSFGAMEVIKEIKQYVDKLQMIANNQGSKMLQAQAYLIDSKIDLLGQQYPQAMEKISQAKHLADKYNLTKLGYQISQEYDATIEQITKWKDETGDIQVNQRFDELQFDKLFQKLSVDKYKDESIIAEDPLALLLLDKAGNLRFSKKFSDQIDINENLIGSFLSAINIFSQDIFHTNHSIDRIKYGTYVIMFKTYETFSLCYIYVGESFLAEKKVEQLASVLLDHQIVNDLILVSDLNPLPNEMGDLLYTIYELFENNTV